LSLVVPAHDERGNLVALHRRVREVLEERDWELVLVDDGSHDGSPEVMRCLVEEDPRVHAVLLEQRHGQTTALCAGVLASRGEVVATLDADLQNDPADLPAMLALLDEWDAVVGFRRERRDSAWRRVSSRLANAVRNALSGDRIVDTGCSLKVFRRDALLSVPWFEGMHRFLPTLLRYQGFRVLEHPVSHRAREWGRSKYGTFDRALRALHDLLAVRWMRSRMIRARLSGVVESEPVRTWIPAVPRAPAVSTVERRSAPTTVEERP
jgi:glycosyltransferase involved in cell wall biosynthesis